MYKVSFLADDTSYGPNSAEQEPLEKAGAEERMKLPGCGLGT